MDIKDKLKIGLFMGWILNEDGTVSNPEWTDRTNPVDKWQLRVLEQYQTWDWIMPVVKKIKSMNPNSLKHIPISEALLSVDIDKLLIAVLDFINECGGENIENLTTNVN